MLSVCAVRMGKATWLNARAAIGFSYVSSSGTCTPCGETERHREDKGWGGAGDREQEEYV